MVVLSSLRADAQVVLTEAEALRRLDADSPRMRALRAQVDLARSDAVAARRFPNPRITLSREAVAGVVEYYPLVAQPLPVTGRRRLEIQAADASLQSVEFRTADLARRARAELRLAFATLVEQQTREEQLEAAVARLRELATILVRREEEGDAAGYDRLRAEREVLELETDLTVARAARAEAQGLLAAFFSPAVDPFSIKAQPSETARALPSLDLLLAHAERSRGDLRALERDIEAARFSRRAAERRFVPEPEVVSGVKTSSVGRGDRGSVVSVVASIPLFDRARAERLRAEASERRATADLELLRNQLRARIAGLHAAFSEGRAVLESYRHSALGRTEQLERIARISYEAGERGILELLDAYRSASMARLRLAELTAGVVELEIELEFISGWETLP
jgi:cobalt-zinc-cadmium efflux system outer membrane protein